MKRFAITLAALVPGDAEPPSRPGGGQRVNLRMMGPPEFTPITRWGVLPGG